MALWDLAIHTMISVVKGAFSLSLIMQDVDTGGRWKCSSVYGPHSDGEREILWKNLEDFHLSQPGPWVIRVDFNTRRFVNEKSTGGTISKGMRDFNSFISRCSLVDLPLQGVKFT